MIRMKTGFMVLATILFTSNAIAQTIEDGKKFLYYERYKSAKEVFQKITASNPSDESANYFLGQAMIGLEDVAGAKALYLQKLGATPNSPLILAGMGHIGLIEGNKADAKSRFETAINLSGAKRIDVLNAVGAPNSDPEMINGDANYAVDKLSIATAIKGFKDPEVLVNLGDAYRKIGDGGNAVKSYEAAALLNPSYARATYRKGRLYQSQGISQEPLYLGLYNEAIAKDAKYAPVYNTLFNYYYKINVTKAADNLEKSLAVSDDDPSVCYKRASMKFAQKMFNEAISKADECIVAGGANPLPNLYGVKGYSYNMLNDSVNARKYFEEFIAKQTPAKIGAGDYRTYATILLKFIGSEQQAGINIDKAVALDTLESDKVADLKLMAVAYKGQNNLLEAANWFNKILYVKKNYGVSDLYNAGYNYYRANRYDSSIVVFNKYATKFPDDMFGTYMIAKNTAASIDSTMAKGEAAAAYLKAIEIGEKATDKNKVKDYLVGAYTFMMQYSFNIKRDQATAISYADKALALDPTDAQSIKNKDFVTKNNPVAPKATPKVAPKAAPKTAPAAPVKKPAAPVKKK
jgi:tetratricopeptide (TPR) repeat protein